LPEETRGQVCSGRAACPRSSCPHCDPMRPPCTAGDARDVAGGALRAPERFHHPES